jgi:fumarate reductase subunit D
MRFWSRDDNGAKVRMRWLWLVPAPLTPRSFPQRVWWRAMWLVPEPVWPVAMVMVGLLLLLGLVLMHGPYVIAVTIFSPVASTFMVVGLALLLWCVRACGRHARRVRDALLARRLCPVCMYDLGSLAKALPAIATEGTPENPASFTTCPECGAHWNLHEQPKHEVIIIREPGSDLLGKRL